MYSILRGDCTLVWYISLLTNCILNWKRTQIAESGFWKDFMADTRIGTLLLHAGLITQAQLQDATALSTDSGKSIELSLIEQASIAPQKLAQFLATHAGLPYVETIADSMADPALLAKIPLKFLRDNVIIPVKIDGQITLLAANPLNFQPLDDVNLLLSGAAQYAVSSYPAIINAINKYYPLEGSKQMIEELKEEPEGMEQVEFAEIGETDILEMATEAPIIKLVNNILYQAVKRNASDIHIEPFEKELRVRYRIDGVMYDIMSPPKRIQGALSSRIKIMSNLNIAEKRLSQDGRMQIKVADKAIDVRVSVLPVVFGERIVMRLLDKSRTFGNLETIGLSERDLKIVRENIHRPNGIIYVTGPTGSGKTSTLYSILGELNTPGVNIITVEDPVEYQMAGVGQVQVKEKIGLTFAAALRSILRQDPDIVMIGETRDQETAQIAVQAALTGHLVLSTLHTNSAAASITRLIDMGVEPFLIASSVALVIAQRLVRKLCPNCKKPYKPEPDVLKKLGLTAKEAEKITFYKAVGCSECLETGYQGRLAVFEVMEMTAGTAALTMSRADTAQIRTQAIKDGMVLLVQDGVRKIAQGLTSVEEVLAVATMEYTVEV
jgi:general secretion pathway protein E